METRIGEIDWSNEEEGAKKLQKLALFSYLSLEELREVYRVGEIRTIQMQAHAVVEGADGNGMFLILSGTVSVYKTDPSTKAMLRLTLLEKDSIFGELSLFDKAPRSATVVAESTCVVFFLETGVFHELLERLGSDVKARFFRGCAEDAAVRLRRQNLDYVMAQKLLWEYGLRVEDGNKDQKKNPVPFKKPQATKLPLETKRGA